MIVQHDFIIIEPEFSKGVLKITDDNINSGIVKGFGSGYYAENGTFIRNIIIKLEDKITFTQHLNLDIDGEKIYVVRGRDVIMVEDGNKI